jgi:hypothetical protein
VRTADGDVSVSSAAGTMNYGATPDLGMIVGRYVDVTTPPAQHWGFVLDGTGLHYFRVPGSSFTQALGVSARGEIVGYAVKEGVTRGFLRDGDEYADIAHPGAVDTYVWATNASGDIAGGAWDGTREHGLLGKRRH